MPIAPVGFGQFTRATEVNLDLRGRVLLLEASRRELIDERASGELTGARLAMVDAEIDLIDRVLKGFRALAEIEKLTKNGTTIRPAEDELLDRVLVA